MCLGNTLLQGGRLALFAATGLAVAGLVSAVFLVQPQRCTRADDATTLSTSRVLVIVLILGAFRALQAHASFLTRLTVSRGYDCRPSQTSDAYAADASAVRPAGCQTGRRNT